MSKPIWKSVSWDYGPLFEIYVRFNMRLRDFPLVETQRILRVLNIDGPYESKEAIELGAFVATWPRNQISLGTWSLERHELGVLVDLLEDTCLYLGIPPGHVRQVCGNYPWNLRADWATVDTLSFHRELLVKARALYRAYPTMTGVSLVEEGWGIPKGDGVLVHTDMASRLFHHYDALSDHFFARASMDELERLRPVADSS